MNIGSTYLSFNKCEQDKGPNYTAQTNLTEANP